MYTNPTPALPTELDHLHELFAAAKAMARGYAAKLSSTSHLTEARSFCFEMLTAHWQARAAAQGCEWAVSDGPVSRGPVDGNVGQLARQLGELAAAFHPNMASYLLGTVYTAMLPGIVRSEWGAFYTPPPYVERLMDLAEEAGFDWAKGRAIDPSCGGGAFLTPVALRMLAAMPAGSPALRLARIVARLQGAELDPFAAWMSHVLLEAALLPLCVSANRRLPSVIRVGDSLNIESKGEYDLVIGNPPYGRVSLSPEMRMKYSRSLFGHANLYGLFTDLAVRLAKPKGIVAYVTPTSFLGGQYFKSLRELLLSEAPPTHIDFLGERAGIFDDVLQETLLAVYKKGRTTNSVRVSCINQVSPNFLTVAEAGSAPLPQSSEPWILPRSASHIGFVERLGALHSRLSTFGYIVSTGPLVWNRHKNQLRTAEQGCDVYPLIWAESISSSGFEFSASRRNHVPFIQVEKTQEHLLMEAPCVLVQRTTAKEQDRRLIAAVLPNEFLAHYGAVVVENHLNIVHRKATAEGINPATIAAVLNSKAVDTAFRCISGSVAVSAYELNALPLPCLQEMQAIQILVESGADSKLIERRLDRVYGGAA